MWAWCSPLCHCSARSSPGGSHDAGRADAARHAAVAPGLHPAQYVTIGVLFVNVSIGGTLTPFTARLGADVLAATWNWDMAWFADRQLLAEAAVAVVINAASAMLLLFIINSNTWARPGPPGRTTVPLSRTWDLFLFFPRVHDLAAPEPADPARTLLVAFFLGGLVVLGGLRAAVAEAAAAETWTPMPSSLAPPR